MTLSEGMVGGQAADAEGRPLWSDSRFGRGVFSGVFLTLGAVSLTLKLLLPVLVAMAEGSVWLTYASFDLWWVLFLYIGWKLQAPAPGIWKIGMASCLAIFLFSAAKLFMATGKGLWAWDRAMAFFDNFFAFLACLAFFFYLFKDETRREFGAPPSR